MSGPKLRFFGKEYSLSDLSPQARACCEQVRYCDERIAQIRIELEVLQTARQGAIGALQPLLVSQVPLAE